MAIKMIPLRLSIILLGIFAICMLLLLYFTFQMQYKPWLKTEFTLMEVHQSNKETLLENGKDVIATYCFIVKNPPYNLKDRYNMVWNFLLSNPKLVPKSGNQIINVSFTKEGWNITDYFPYVRYVDRTYKDSPVTYGDYYGNHMDGHLKNQFVPYCGAMGIANREMVSFEIDFSEDQCLMHTHLDIKKPFLYIEALFEPVNYDNDNFGKSYDFISGWYTPDMPNCAGKVKIKNKPVKGLRPIFK